MNITFSFKMKTKCIFVYYEYYYLLVCVFFTVLFQDSNPQTLKNALFVLAAHSAVA